MVPFALGVAGAAWRSVGLGRLSRRRMQIGFAHRHTFAIAAENHDGTRILDFLGRGTALGGIEHLKILRGTYDQLFGLALRHGSPRRGRESRAHVIKRILGGFHRHTLPDTVRVTFWRQVQRRIQGMQAWGTRPPIPHTHNLNCTKERQQVSRMASLWQAWMTLGVSDRFCRNARTTLIHVGLEQAA
jgi:hypothetical protein